MRENGALSVSDAIARIPGVTQLTTGVGISKPVIRGLYGNRVQVITQGQRFDNQQWQDEHGLGLSTDGVERVEVIKGAAALQYGSDAIGGVVNVIDEKPAPIDSTQQDLRLQLFSNTRGLSAGYGIRKSDAKKWWRIRAGADSHGDFSRANDARVINSRFASYTVKAAVGWQHKRWVSANSLMASMSEFGFVFDSLASDVRDERPSRSFAGPHHTVILGVFSSENTFYGDKLKWKLNAGWTSNKRQEQEGGNKISLDMLLSTASLVTQATARIGQNGSWTNGASFLYQTNTNVGARIIVPDATTLEGSVFSYVKQRTGKVTMEGGARFDLRSIDAIRTLDLNLPFSKSWNALNGSLGLAWDPIEELNIKANVSSGYRSGNLAELGSSGLHEGTRRWEIGDPDLGVERNLNAEAGFTYEWAEQVELGVSVYRNAFADYIYLTPTGTDTLGLHIYRFVQTDATLQGGEATLDIHPKASKWIDATIGYSHVQADKGDGTPLPFIPADRLRGDLKFTSKTRAWLKLGVSNVSAQDRPAQFETSTPAYTLVNASLGTSLVWNKSPLEIVLVCNNLTDEKYVDHLSRFKTFGLYDIGRNISLSLKLEF
jgi:iron complex outermembrane receptor protein